MKMKYFKIGCIIWISIILLTLFSNIVNAEKSAIEINSNPKELNLSPGETTTITLEIKSKSNKTLFVGFVFLVGKCPDHPRGHFNLSYFKLQPFQSTKILLTLRASNQWFKDEGCNDVAIMVYWGENLSKDPDEFRTTSEDKMFYKIEVYENNTIPYLIIVLPIMGICIFIILLVRHIIRKKSKK
jgi:hypothetical protein